MTGSSVAFMRLVNQAMGDDLQLRLLREDEQCAVYAGLWSTWWINDTNRAASAATVALPLNGGWDQVIFATVLRDPAVKPPPGPLRFGDLLPCSGRCCLRHAAPPGRGWFYNYNALTRSPPSGTVSGSS